MLKASLWLQLLENYRLILRRPRRDAFKKGAWDGNFFVPIMRCSAAAPPIQSITPLWRSQVGGDG